MSASDVGASLALWAAAASALIALQSPAEPFDLRAGQSATLQIRGAEVVLRFERVTADSRCPVGATCIWEGDAVVRVVVTAHARTATHDLHTNPRFEQERDHEGIRVRLLKLEPHPRVDEAVEPQDYVATFVLEPESRAGGNGKEGSRNPGP
ncbi:MAG TPA: hypothetical protein VD833_04640 [Vicinamibacterales bacterium]|nr:hypothetical protein [Vicinamibacterales bacterium]